MGDLTDVEDDSPLPFDEEDMRLAGAGAPIRDLGEELLAERARTEALLASLPTCEDCGAPATRSNGRGDNRYCDTHGEPLGVREYPRAAAIRAILASRKEPSR